MTGKFQSTRCIHCRSDVAVPASYADGDHIKCGSCGTQHRVVRGEGVRLVLADVEPLREAVRENDLRIASLESELTRTRAALGMGANGILFGIVYLVWQVSRGRIIDQKLIIEAIGASVASFILLELANYLFLAKRMAIMRLSNEIEQIRSEGKILHQRIREAARK